VKLLETKKASLEKDSPFILGSCADLLYNLDVQLKFNKISLVYLVFTLCFCFIIEAKTPKSKSALKLADKREIVKLLLENISKNSPGKTIYVSSKNLPANIQNDLSQIKNAEIKLIAPEKPANANLCAYQFDGFEVLDKYVSVSLGDCNSGLVYNFKKIRGKWTAVPFAIEK